jgi:hypothetical protein
MNLFGDKPQEKAMQSLIHDTNRDTSNLDYRLGQLDKWLKENGKKITEAGIDTSAPFVITEYIRSASKSIQKDIDAYYTKFSKDFEQ